MEEAKIVVVGAGIVGLAVAARISALDESVFVLEKNDRYGQETSTHNSAVVHSGIHYPPGSLKARLCVAGNRMIYETCEKHGIPYSRLGKLTVANRDEEFEELEKLKNYGEKNGVEGMEILERAEIKKMEPYVEAQKALYTPSTGIVEPDELMDHYYYEILRNNGILATNTEVRSLARTSDGYIVSGISQNDPFSVKAGVVINCAGLFADRIVEMLGMDAGEAGYHIYPCKGDYFRLNRKPPVKMLIYPVPKGPGLGTHLTPDLSGVVRLGPNAYYVDRIDYQVESDMEEFKTDVQRFFPIVKDFELVADFAGIRPKLQGPNDSFRDFVIKHETEKGFHGFINLVGIESPGLTSAPAIAEFVKSIYEKELVSQS